MMYNSTSVMGIMDFVHNHEHNKKNITKGYSMEWQICMIVIGLMPKHNNDRNGRLLVRSKCVKCLNIILIEMEAY